MLGDAWAVIFFSPKND